MQLTGTTITIPKHDLWDDVMWRVLAVEPDGGMMHLIKRLRQQATPEHISAALQTAGELMGASQVTVKELPPLANAVSFHAFFPDSKKAWRVAHRLHTVDAVPNMPAPPESFYRGYWTPLGDDIDIREKKIRGLPVGMWRLGGLGRHSAVKRSADYRLLRLIWQRRDWQSQLANFYAAACWRSSRTATADVFDALHQEPLAPVNVPGQRGLMLRAPLLPASRGQAKLFVPTGCRPVPRAELYQACDSF